MIKNKKKLVICAESIRQLDELDLKSAGGAGRNIASVAPIRCDSDKVCPTSL